MPISKKTSLATHFNCHNDLYLSKASNVSLYEPWGPSWSWSYISCIYNCLCNQCLSPLKLRVRTPFMARCTRYNSISCNKVCQWLATGLWFSLGTQVSPINKTDCHDITEISLKVVLNTTNQTKPTNLEKKNIIKNNLQTCRKRLPLVDMYQWEVTHLDPVCLPFFYLQVYLL